MQTWNVVPDDNTIQRVIEALRLNGIEAVAVEDFEQAKEAALESVPAGGEVMTMSSVTLDALGISKEINESGKYKSVRMRFKAMDPKTQQQDMNKLGAAPEYSMGSVHAITEDGHVLIASASGSQLAAHVYGAGHVVWVAGAQKIVKNTDDGIKRIYEHCLPLENERAMKAYGKNSSVNKMLIINKESVPGRMKLILVKQVVGF